MNNYITAEEFLKQSDKVQKELLEWWKLNVNKMDLCSQEMGDRDLFTNKVKICHEKLCILNNRHIEYIKSKKIKVIPLLQIHQLIQFIGDKTVYHSIELFNQPNVITITVATRTKMIRETFYEDLLQALWKTAIKIVEEEV